MRKINYFILFVVTLSFALGYYFYPLMPQNMASHWGVGGDVNGYMPKFWGLFLMPVITLAMWLMFLLIPTIDPKKSNIDKFRGYFDGFIAAIILFLFYIYCLTMAWNLGWRFDMGRALSPALAILFYCAGILIEKARPNWFIGIRTPWTLSSDVVWQKTHQLGAKLFKICAVLALGGLAFPGLAFYLVFAPVIFSALYLFVYSYFAYKREKIKK